MRVLADTNVLASALATRGLCAELLEDVVNRHTLLVADPVLGELRQVLSGKFRLPAAVIAGFLDLLRSEGELIVDPKPLSLSFEDPDDIPILACAVAGGADAFVTGDKALLALRAVEGIPILSPRALWRRLAEGER